MASAWDTARAFILICPPILYPSPDALPSLQEVEREHLLILQKPIRKAVSGMDFDKTKPGN